MSKVVDVDELAWRAASIGSEKVPVVGVDTKETVDKLHAEVSIGDSPGLDADVTNVMCKLTAVVALGHVSGGGRESVTTRDPTTRVENVKPG